MEILSKENEIELEDDIEIPLLKKKLPPQQLQGRPVGGKKDPNRIKKVLTDGQLKALTAMNDARTKKAEEKLKVKYNKLIEKENAKNVLLPTQPRAPSSPRGKEKENTKKGKSAIIVDSDSDTSLSSSSSEEIQIIHKTKRIKDKKKKKKKKIIIMESSSSSSSESEEEIHHHPTRQMRTQQNRKTVIQQHNQKQISKDFFCS
jgi:hypothetical protein